MPYLEDPLAAPFDLNNDKFVDKKDIETLLADRNKSVDESRCGKPCDFDKDGKITVNDVRSLTFKCTFAGCITDGIKDFSPDKIKNILTRVNSAGEFVDLLPREFKEHWIMMTRSESVQTGTATSPRILLPSQDSSKVFGLALTKDVLFPGDPDKIEYLQFDRREGVKKFRFHEINVKTGMVDQPRSCEGCHSGRPNWDAYDSWGGMLPFNRDRIYENSEEHKAFKRLLEELQNDPIVKRLELPKGITREGNGNMNFVFDREDAGENTVNVRFKKETGDLVSYPGPSKPVDGAVDVIQGGKYLRLHHSDQGDATDQGRAVALFDNFTEYNAQRVAQDLLEHHKREDIPPESRVDVRPIALAIAQGDCVNDGNLTDFAPKTKIDAFFKYHEVTGFDALVQDTKTRRERLPKLKADLQAYNLAGPHPFGLIRVNRERGATTAPLDETTITQEVFRRSNENKPMEFPHDTLTGFMIDRERTLAFDAESRTIARFRFFLEPLGVGVGNWSMSVLDRSSTYTFGDLFSQYTDQIRIELEKALKMEGMLEEALDPDQQCKKLIDLSKTALGLP